MKGWKKILVLVLCFSIAMATIPTKLFEDVNAASTDTIILSYVFSEPKIEKTGEEYIVKVRGCREYELPNKPLTPYKKVTVLLPAGKDIEEIKVTHGKPKSIKTIAKPKYGGIPLKISDQFQRNIEQVQKKIDTEYPNEIYEVVGEGFLRGFKLLNIHLYPVKYLSENELLFFPKIKIEIKTKDSHVSPLFRGAKEDYDIIAARVSNPSAITTYESDATNAIPLALPPGNYKYVVITDASLESAFQRLVDYKNNFLTATIVNLTYIQNNYAGVDLAEQIRNFIKDAYLNWGTEYILLGGDVEIIPSRQFYVVVPTSPPTTGYIPADLYYAALDGTWNDDGDSYWGEIEDNPDWYAEVYVGRAPVNTLAEAEVFVNKTIAFETAVKPKLVQLHQSRLSTTNSPDSTAVPEACAQWIPADYTINRLYEEYGTVTKTDWINAFGNGPLIFQHCGHGDVDLYYINYYLGGSYIWYNTDVPSLSNTFYPLQISIACYSGAFDYVDCLAEELVKYANGGASACIMNSRYGWYSSLDANAYSGEFMQRHFYELFVSGTQNWSKMMQFAKEYYASNAASDEVYRWCYYEINLLGDPETPALITRITNQPPTCSLTASPSSGNVPLTTTFYMNASDPDGVISSWELDVDGDGVAEYSGAGEPPATQQHTYNSPGDYTAKLTVWDDNGAVAYDTTTVSVIAPNTPPDAPTNPSPTDGATNVSLSPTLSVYVYDADGDTLDVSFYDASDNSLIGTDTGVPSGGTASIVWSGLSPNTTYSWYAVASDGTDSNQSATWTFTTAALTTQQFYPIQDIAVTNGGIINDYTYTFDSDDQYEAITEATTGNIVTIFYETFPNADLSWNGDANGDTVQDETGWICAQGSDGDVSDVKVSSLAIGSGDLPPSGGNHLILNDCDTGSLTPPDESDWAVIPIDLSGYTNVNISWYWQTDDVDIGEGLTVAYSTDATDGSTGTWTIIATYDNPIDDTWFHDYFILPDTDAVSTFMLGFFSKSTSGGENVYVDDIKITGQVAPTSELEHKWVFNVTGGYSTYTFYIEAYHTANTEGDDFIFAYSLDDITYTNMLTITKTTDDNTYQTFVFPEALSGTVYIKVIDADRTAGNGVQDTIYIDSMYIEGS